jgi:CheY-like chemotaxis protein
MKTATEVAVIIGAEGGTRTLTLLRAADFESAASTDSATSARPRSIADQVRGAHARPHRGCSEPAPAGIQPIYSDGGFAEVAMAALNGMRVLVVENDEMNAMLLEMQLQQAGASVVGPAGVVDDALRLTRERAPQLAVLDYRLGDGETSEPVAGLLTELGIPFVLATGFAGDSVPAAFRAGHVLTKPYLAEELIATLLRARGQDALEH